jgi:hypothetical protein
MEVVTFHINLFTFNTSEGILRLKVFCAQVKTWFEYYSVCKIKISCITLFYKQRLKVRGLLRSDFITGNITGIRSSSSLYLCYPHPLY